MVCKFKKNKYFIQIVFSKNNREVKYAKVEAQLELRI